MQCLYRRLRNLCNRYIKHKDGSRPPIRTLGMGDVRGDSGIFAMYNPFQGFWLVNMTALVWLAICFHIAKIPQSPVTFLLPFILLVTLTHSLAWLTTVPASIITWCQLVKVEFGVAVHHEIRRLSMHASSVVVYWLCTQQSSSHVPQISSCWGMRAASQYGISCGPAKEAGCYDALSVNHFLHISFQSIICFLMIRKRRNSIAKK